MTNTKAELIYYEKEKVQEHYILEIAIHRLVNDFRLLVLNHMGVAL